MKKILLLAVTTISLIASSQTYIPSASVSKDQAQVILTYNGNKGGNRPGATVKFSDGQELMLACTCDDPYNWCIKNEDFDDVGYLKLDFLQNGKVAKLSIKKSEDSTPYLKYLNLLTGNFKKIQ